MLLAWTAVQHAPLAPSELARPNMNRHGLAGVLARLYMALFYNTNFLLNLTLSLTVLLPLFLVERISGVPNGQQFTQQVVVAAYSSFLYAIVYVENDLIDYRRDGERRPFKASLLSQTGSRRRVVLFVTWYTATLVVAGWLFPSLGPLLVGYVLLLLTVGTVHSYFAVAKPVTLFIERGLRFLAPSFLIYVLSPNLVTLAFLVGAIAIYPVVMNDPYVRYLKNKCEWNRRLKSWTLALYGVYYFCFLVGVLIYGGQGGHLPTSSDAPSATPIGTLIFAPILLVFYFTYERAIRWMAYHLPDGLVPEGNPSYPGERKLSACQAVVTAALVGLLTVTAYA